MWQTSVEFAEVFRSRPAAVFRVRFKDGDVFDLRLVRDSSGAAGRPNTWTGFSVGRSGLNERRNKLYPIGGGLDFVLDDIETIEGLPW